MEISDGSLRPTHEGLVVVAALVAPLAKALGPGVEVVLHELSRIPDSIVAISGTVTGRRDGGPSSDLLLKHIRSGRHEDLFAYESVSVDGLPMKSSSMFIHDAAGVPIGCLCINVDVSALVSARDLLDAIVGIGSAPQPAAQESFTPDVEQLTESMIDRALALVPVPPHLMRKAQRMKVVGYLDQQGFFLLRDAIELAAGRLGITRFTIYNYLNELRQDDADRVPHAG